MLTLCFLRRGKTYHIRFCTSNSTLKVQIWICISTSQCHWMVLCETSSELSVQLPKEELLVLSILENTGNNDFLNGLGIASQAGPSYVFSSFSPLTCFKLEATVLSENMERFHQQPLWHEIIWPCTIVPANVNLSTTTCHIHNRQTCYVQNSCECLNPNPDSLNA